MLALAECLKARGHEALVHTWHRWQPEIEAAGLQFTKAPQYDQDPVTGEYLAPYEAVRRAVLDSEGDVAAFRPDVMVSDVLSNTTALIAERLGIPSATLVPHVYPLPETGMTPYSMGVRSPRTIVGKTFWGRINRMMDEGYQQGEKEFEELRQSLDLPPAPGPMPTLSRELTIVATFPQLEYARNWPSWAHVTGPLLWEPPFAASALPPGDEPLVIVAPSTIKDPTHRMLRSALRGLAGDEVRVLATTNRRHPQDPVFVGNRQQLVTWLSYANAMPHADVVVCNGGHGTIVRALASGCAVLVVPDDGDQRENALRVDYAGVGARLPRRWTTPNNLRIAVRQLLDDDGVQQRVRDIAAWNRDHPGDASAAELVEALARKHLHDRSAPPIESPTPSS